MSETTAEIPTRVAVLEEIARTTRDVLTRIERRLDVMDDRIDHQFANLESRFDKLGGRIDRLEERIDRLEERIDQRFGAVDERLRVLETGVAELRGKVTQLPNIWHLMATLLGAAVTFGGLVIAGIHFTLH